MRILFALLALAGLLFAEELKITAESFESDEKKGLSIFEGNVRIKKGNDELNATKVTIFTNKSRRPTKFIAEKDVSFYIRTANKESYVGRAQKVIFLPDEKEYRFYTDVHLKQLNEKKQIDGDEVVVNIQEGRAVAKGAAKEPVIMIFEMQDDNGSL